ncbi:ferredoxin [Actinomadura sp. NEAU-AAG7]|uniref:ferredoxin n=1 Tax=Actinomadura sp. NEAU-AAG7 TaxID=2839640 RepID=UPI001BE3DF31|nr:ferredoxin [Actinomadura sp. NEAU-AAG7]MBT2211257.1 ferredoxin [Actinomadura sp. NEAU-AAG7]
MDDEQWRVQVDRRTCIGSGLCTAIAEGHFTLDEGRSRPTAEVIAPEEAVLDAAEFCPVEAILVRAAGTRTVLAPQP